MALAAYPDERQARAELRDLLRPGQTHLRMSKSTQSDRRKRLTVLAGLGVECWIASCAGESAVIARQTVLRRLAQELLTEPKPQLILERQSGEAPRDRRTLADVTGTDRTRLAYRHEDKRADPLLWGADACVWVAGAPGHWTRAREGLFVRRFAL